MSNTLSILPNKRETLWGCLYILLSQTLLPLLLPFCLQLLFPDILLSEINFIYFLLNFCCVTVILRKFLWTSRPQSGQSLLPIGGTALIGLLLYFVLNYAVTMLIVALRPDFFNVNDRNIASLAEEHYLLMVLGTVVLVPITEELLYRGVVFSALQKANPILAYALSILLFSAIHVIGYVGTYHWPVLLLCLLQYIPAGFCLAWVYQRSGSILSPILLHTIINAIGIFSVR